MILCSICARAGSKGVINKNIREINGKPLIAYSIEQAQKSNLFKHIVISTDSDEIAKVGTDFGAEVFFKRSSDLAGDSAGKLDVIRDIFVRSEHHYNKKFDTLIDLDATSPLRDFEDIQKSYRQFQQHDHSNLVTATPSRRSPYFNIVEFNQDGKIGLSKMIPNNIVRRQDSPKTYDLNASIYIWKRKAILSQKSLFDDHTGLYIMPEERSIDIDTELDFKLVEYLLKNKA